MLRHNENAEMEHADWTKRGKIFNPEDGKSNGLAIHATITKEE